MDLDDSVVWAALVHLGTSLECHLEYSCRYTSDASICSLCRRVGQKGLWLSFHVHGGVDPCLSSPSTPYVIILFIYFYFKFSRSNIPDFWILRLSGNLYKCSGAFCRWNSAYLSGWPDLKI